jgi:hypothetical protein
VRGKSTRWGNGSKAWGEREKHKGRWERPIGVVVTKKSPQTKIRQGTNT